jgi:hypothetical protein
MPGYPTHPAHPERVCWGCDQYCAAHDLSCGQDTVRTPHPLELFGDDWNRTEEAPAQTLSDATGARLLKAESLLRKH